MVNGRRVQRKGIREGLRVGLELSDKLEVLESE